jgi:uncharacterized membrane protein YbhN (UPF0104 family)
LRIVISLALLGIFAAVANPVKIWSSLSNFRWNWLPAVFGCIALSILISALKWQVLLAAQDIKISLGSLFGIYMSGLFFNNFLPSSIGGDGVRILLAGKHSGQTGAAAASVVVDRTLASISLAVLGLGGAFFAQHPTPLAVGLLLVLLAVGIVATLVLLIGKVPDFLKKIDSRLSKAITAFIEAGGQLRNCPGALGVSLVLSLAFQLVVALVVAGVIGGLGLPFPGAGDIAFVSSATSVLAMVPLGLNGYGLREGAYIMLLRPLGFAASSAVTVSVLFAIFVSIFSLGGAVHWLLVRPAPVATLLKEED